MTGKICGHDHSHDTVGSWVMALTVLVLGPFPMDVCLLSFYESNEGGEEMTNSTSQAYELSSVFVGFRAAAKVLRASGHGSLAERFL